MKFKSIRFLGSISNISQVKFKRLPEIAIAGRSNVGKSSLINCLVNRKKLALTSSIPGKTRVINYYCLDEKFYLVDLPGYGYAKVSQNERQSWRKLVESYLVENDFLTGIIEIIDSRHGITGSDLDMIKWLIQLGLPTLLVATKTDKLPRSKAHYIIQTLETEATALGVAGVIPFSIITKQGKDQIWQAIVELINAAK
jgi:GTP-binding protein